MQMKIYNRGIRYKIENLIFIYLFLHYLAVDLFTDTNIVWNWSRWIITVI